MNAIEVEKLTKVYLLNHQFNQRLTEALSWKQQPQQSNEVIALNNISFQLPAGSVLGVVGDNGSGKSTLLKIISEITTPTSGEVRLYGTVSSILEVGTGFHQELSGHDNIYLSGSIVGLGKEEIDKRYDEIVAFSGLQNFIDVPVKKYSSGMFMRLAFSLAAHLTADIILLDEVLSVGDADFRMKCLEKIRELTQSDETVVIVSHDLPSILHICTHYLVLEKGVIKEIGESSEILTHYLEQSVLKSREGNSEGDVKLEKQKKLQPLFRWEPAFYESKGIQIEMMGVRSVGKNHNEPMSVDDDVLIECVLHKSHAIDVSVNFILQYQFMHPAAMINSKMDDQINQLKNKTGRIHLSCVIPKGTLNHGLYSVGLYVMDEQFNELIALDDQIAFRLGHEEYYSTKYFDQGKYYGSFKLKLNWLTAEN